MSEMGRQDVIEAVREALQGPCAVPEGTAIVAACSGGADSVALVHALAHLRDRWPVKGVVFVDHGTRDVREEAAAAEGAASHEGLSFTCLGVQLPRHGNLQANARRARYQALEEAAGADAVIATGHTRTDQAETVLQRVVRGTGLRGLASIRPREGRWVRPMLSVTRAVIRELGWPFVDDPSNATNQYLRNRLRAQVIPRLAQENPQVEEALAALAHAAGEEITLVDALLDLVDARHMDLTGATPALAEVVARWRYRRELQPLPPPSRASMEALSRLVVAGGKRGSVSLGHGVRGQAERGRISFLNEADPRFVLVAPGFGTYCLGERVLTVSRSAPENPPDELMEGRSLQMMLDSSKVEWPLRLGPAPMIAPNGDVRTAGPALRLADGRGVVIWESGESGPRSDVLGEGLEPWHVSVAGPLVEIDGLAEVVS
jgi:tRNA(Ile)-lysidine synthetase-like protein